MRDWELVDSDRFSFEDSDRFEEDSLCSWISEPESLCNNWRGWKKSNFTSNPNPVLNNTGLSSAYSNGCDVPGAGPSSSTNKRTLEAGKLGAQLNLVELAAKCVASHIPFEMVERFYPPVPEQLQLRIAFWSFPEHEEDIRLYSCLANGSAEEFMKGERLCKNDCVSETLQIGFHLSATVKPNLREAHKVAVTFDRRRITTCTCSCTSTTNWCGHVAAVCLHRICQTKDVTLRAPVSESLSRLHRDQLQKFAQYLISELPQQILPTAQRLLDELLSSQRSAINTLRGAPDPTAGASANEQTTWFLDEKTLHGNIHKILIKFCVPAPIVFSDVNYLSSAAPPASAEWSSLLRPLRGREPEGMWNLLSIVREMFRREDRNAVPLLEVITEECLNCDQILVWWFNTKAALHNGNSGHGGKHHSVNSNSHACQHAGSSICDEIVVLWRLAALNPGLSPEERGILLNQFKEWHIKIIEKVSKSRNASVGSKHANSFKNDVEVFPGFRPAVEACYLTWESYPIQGITYSESSKIYHCPFMCFRHSDGHSRSGETGMIHSSHAVLNNPAGEHHLLHSAATISSAPGISSKRPRSVDCGTERTPHQPGGSNLNNAAEPVKPSTSSAALETHPRLVPSSNSDPTVPLGPLASKVGGQLSKSKSRKPRSAGGLAADKLHLLGISASGLKLKSEPEASTSSYRGESSHKDELPGPSTSAGNSSKIVKVPGINETPGENLDVFAQANILAGIPLMPARVQRERDAENRSSISSQSEGFCDNDQDVLDGEIEVDGDNDEGVETDPPKPGESQSLNTTTSDEIEGDNEVDGDEADSDESTFARGAPLGISGGGIEIKAGPSGTGNRKCDSSDSQHSGDEYQLYFYDTTKSTSGTSKLKGDSSSTEDSTSGSNKKDSSMGVNVFSNLKRIEDPWDVLFARAEGLHAHGHSKEACKLGVKLATDLLANPPKLTIDLPTAPVGKGKRKKINPISHQISCVASATLAKCGFLCTVLAESSEQYCLAFQVGMFGLELARPPASTKPLEVKLANQEAELAQLLKRIPVGQKELEMMREKAETLKDGTFKSRGEALLPLVLANFIFDVLVMPTNKEGRCTLQSGVYRTPSDEILGFEAAVSAFGLKANVSEAEHPLLCEGTRRQRGDLALTMLLHYKDESEKLAKIMDKLLDREIHQLYKAPLPPAYYSNNPPTAPLLVATPSSRNDLLETPQSTRELSPPSVGSNGAASPAASSSPPVISHTPSNISVVNTNSSLQPSGYANKPESTGANASTSDGNGGCAGTLAADGSESSSSALNPPPTSSSATSSASGPTGSMNGPGSNAATNGAIQNQTTQTTATTIPAKSGRYKGKRAYPVLPNQPSEASAHFMFELAKIVLGKAGGSSNQSLFTQPSNGQNPRGPHRALHMCAFHMGLYALGLHNAVSPNWLSRTYSSHVSWITGQAMEIGAPAIAFLIDTWDSHLTPPEAVTIADRASRGDANMVRAAAELALSCLPFAHALNPNEIHRAILQCKEQSDGMLEKACLTVETAAKGGGVYPEVLFDVARQWFSLYQKHLPLDMDVFNDDGSHHDPLLSLDGGLDSMNPNGHSQVVSPQTGLPPLNPNNPPPLPPSSVSAGPPAGLEMMQLPPPPSQIPHQHSGSGFPMGAPQPMNSIPYTTTPYGQVPFMPNFNPVPGNFVYSQAVLYQTNAPTNPATTSSSYYHPPTPPQQSQQAGPMQPFLPHAPMHPQHPHQHHSHGHHNNSHSMVSSGPPPMQFYPMTSGAPNGHPGHNHMNLRPSSAQFFPVNHPHGHNGMNVMPNQGHHGSNNGPQLAVITAANVQGHPLNIGGNMPMNGMNVQHIPVSHNSHVGGHLVMQNGNPGGPGMSHQGNPQLPPQNGPMVGPQNPQIMIQGPNQMPHGMPVGMNARGPSQPQMNNGGGHPVNHNGVFLPGNNMQPPQQHAMAGMPEMPPTSASSQHFLPSGRESVNSHQQGQSAIKIKYLLAAYRVGMLAMETLARRVHDDRPQAKFARNPPYGEDVKWLLSISRKLGAQYLQQFCICAVNSISNPFVLHEIILDASMIPTRNNLHWVYQNPRSPLAPLVQKCQQMYFQCLHQKLYHITVSDYDDFVSIVCNARQAFHLTADGISQFKEWLTNLRRSKACKKDLWSQITTALQSNSK